VLTETAEKFDILATVAGGGVSGQAGAVRLGISRAPPLRSSTNLELRKKLKEEGLLTRDARRQGTQEVRAMGGSAQNASSSVNGSLKSESKGKEKRLAAIAMKDLLEAGSFTSGTRRSAGTRR